MWARPSSQTEVPFITHAFYMLTHSSACQVHRVVTGSGTNPAATQPGVTDGKSLGLTFWPGGNTALLQVVSIPEDTAPAAHSSFLTIYNPCQDPGYSLGPPAQRPNSLASTCGLEQQRLLWSHQLLDRVNWTGIKYVLDPINSQ